MIVSVKGMAFAVAMVFVVVSNSFAGDDSKAYAACIQSGQPPIFLLCIVPSPAIPATGGEKLLSATSI
jgi:hypothetical protein